jgi:hypothetical protein
LSNIRNTTGHIVSQHRISLNCDKLTKTVIKRALANHRNGKVAGFDKTTAEAIKVDLPFKTSSRFYRKRKF